MRDGSLHLSQQPLLPSIQQSPSAAQETKTSSKVVFVQHPWQLYSLALLPLLIIPITLGFYGTLAHGSLYAPQGLADIVTSKPRQAAQIVTILGSFLTGIVKWGLSQAFVLTAQKRFRKFRPVFEAEVWSSLKNGGIMWTRKIERVRVLATLATAMVALLCGLMTSGFVSLFSPLPLMVKKDVIAASELDILANSSQCVSWLDDRWKGWQGGNINNWLAYKDFKFQEADVTEALVDILGAGRASMLAHIMTSVNATSAHTFISTLARLGNTRILGTTAGVIPMGPGGIQAFSVQAVNSDSAASVTNSRLNGHHNYTITQQGVSLTVSCEYIGQSSLPYIWLNDSTIRIECPPSTTGSYEKTALSASQIIVAWCLNTVSGYDWYLQSRFPPDKPPEQDPSRVYAGIGAMRCNLRHYIGEVTATYDASISAYRMYPSLDMATPSQKPWLIERAYIAAGFSLLDSQTHFAGNLAGSLIDSLAVSLYDLPSGRKHEKYPPLIASYIKGIFEYQVSHFRLFLEASNFSAPQECRRPVTGTVTYPVIGWNAQTSTLLSLLPLGIIGCMIAFFVCWTISLSEKLPLFDPTNSVSLIATASAGGVHFGPGEVGDPEDEVVRTTRVIYGPLLPDAPLLRGGTSQDQVSNMSVTLNENIGALQMDTVAPLTVRDSALIPQLGERWGLVAADEGRGSTKEQPAEQF